MRRECVNPCTGVVHTWDDEAPVRHKSIAEMKADGSWDWALRCAATERAELQRQRRRTTGYTRTYWSTRSGLTIGFGTITRR